MFFKAKSYLGDFHDDFLSNEVKLLAQCQSRAN